MGAKSAVLMLAMALTPMGAQAAKSLSCEVQNDLKTAATAPKVTEFTWSGAHGPTEAAGAIKTGIGRIARGTAQSALTLDRKPVQLPDETRGAIRFGKVYDYGSYVVLAYRVEREFDASATPSEVVFRLDKSRTVTEADVLPGEAAFDDIQARDYPDHCTLVE